MNEVIFGNGLFSITAQNLELIEEAPLHSQLEIVLAGEGWELQALRGSETLSIVASRLADFAGNSASRHWGSFVGLGTIEETIDRVRRHAFGGENPAQGEFFRWDMSSAFGNYSLSSCFDNGLGVEQAISVRGVKHETLIWQSLGGEIRSASIKNARFDETFSSFVDWASALLETGSARDGV